MKRKTPRALRAAAATLFVASSLLVIVPNPAAAAPIDYQCSFGTVAMASMTPPPDPYPYFPSCPTGVMGSTDTVQFLFRDVEWYTSLGSWCTPVNTNPTIPAVTNYCYQEFRLTVVSTMGRADWHWCLKPTSSGVVSMYSARTSVVDAGPSGAMSSPNDVLTWNMWDVGPPGGTGDKHAWPLGTTISWAVSQPQPFAGGPLFCTNLTNPEGDATVKWAGTAVVGLGNRPPQFNPQPCQPGEIGPQEPACIETCGNVGIEIADHSVCLASCSPGFGFFVSVDGSSNGVGTCLEGCGFADVHGTLEFLDAYECGDEIPVPGDCAGIVAKGNGGNGAKKVFAVICGGTDPCVGTIDEDSKAWEYTCSRPEDPDCVVDEADGYYEEDGQTSEKEWVTETQECTDIEQ